VEYPLSGISIVVAGTDSFTKKLDDRLSELGGNITRLNHMQTTPHFENIPKEYSKYTHIVFTSTNGVEVFFEYLKANSVDVRNVLNKRFATVGKSTADTLAKYGIYADIVPQKYTSKDLANAIVDNYSLGDNYLILRAENGSTVLTDTLREHNIPYEDVKTYSLTCDTDTLNAIPLEDLQYVVFGSAMGVREFFRCRTLPTSVEIVCIGEVCKSALDSLQLENTIHVADSYNVDGIVQKLLEISV
jgi:uroporphyrinogen III methyltransferase/synthase